MGAGAFWAASGRQSVPLMASAISLIALGAYQGVVEAASDEEME
jgi:hypothetical protein